MRVHPSTIRDIQALRARILREQRRLIARQIVESGRLQREISRLEREIERLERLRDAATGEGA